MDRDIAEFWLKLEQWYDTEAALLVMGQDPRVYTQARKPARRLLRDRFPRAADLVMVFERSLLMERGKEYHSNWKYLMAARQAGYQLDPTFAAYLDSGSYLSPNTSSGKAVPPAASEGAADRRGGHKQQYELENLHKLLALLLSAFLDARRSKLMGHIERPNVSQIVTELMKHGAERGFDMVGVGRTSMTEKIGEAIALYQEHHAGP